MPTCRSLQLHRLPIRSTHLPSRQLLTPFGDIAKAWEAEQPLLHPQGRWHRVWVLVLLAVRPHMPPHQVAQNIQDHRPTRFRGVNSHQQPERHRLNLLSSFHQFVHHQVKALPAESPDGLARSGRDAWILEGLLTSQTPLVDRDRAADPSDN